MYAPPLLTLTPHLSPVVMALGFFFQQAVHGHLALISLARSHPLAPFLMTLEGRL